MFLLEAKFAQTALCQRHHISRRNLQMLRFFSQAGLQRKEESEHVMRPLKHKSRIPKKGPSFWERAQKEYREQWEKALAGVLLIGMGMGLGLKGMSYTNAVEQSLEEGTFISNSLDRLRNDDRALFLIGFPICNLSIDYRDEKNTFTNEEEAKILVPVSGPSGEGNFYLHAVRENDGYWQAKRCELEMTKCSALEEKKWKGKRLVVFDQERHGNILAVNKRRK